MTCNHPEQEPSWQDMVYNVDISYDQSEDKYTGDRNIANLVQEL